MQKHQGYSFQRTEGSRRADGRIWVGGSLSPLLILHLGLQQFLLSEGSEEVSRGRGVLWYPWELG